LYRIIIFGAFYCHFKGKEIISMTVNVVRSCVSTTMIIEEIACKAGRKMNCLAIALASGGHAQRPKPLGYA